ncbi:hypothetical protein SGCOL_001887 [Colletotrichum sp. CLE4]
MSLSLPLYKREVQDPDNKPLRRVITASSVRSTQSTTPPGLATVKEASGSGVSLPSDKSHNLNAGANSHTCDSRMMYTVRARDVPCEDPSQCPYGPKAHSHSVYKYSKVDKKKVKCGDRAEQVWRANQKRLLAEKQEGEVADEARPGSSSDQHELIRLFAKPNKAKEGNGSKLQERNGESPIKSTAEPEKLSEPITFGPSQCSLPEYMIKGTPLIPLPYLSAGGWTFPRPHAEAEKKEKEREKVVREAEKVRVEMATPIMKQSQEDQPQQEKTQKDPEEEAEAKKQMWRQINENTTSKQTREQESQASKVGEENALKTRTQRLTDQQRHWEELRNRVLREELRLKGTLVRNTAQETEEHILSLANEHVQYYELKVKQERKEREDHILKLKQEWERRAEHVVLRQQQQVERELEIGQQHELELEEKQRDKELQRQEDQANQRQREESQLKQKQRQQHHQQEERALTLKKFYEDEKKRMEQQRREELQRQEARERQREEYELQMKQREEQQQEQQVHELRQKQRQEIILKQQQRHEAIQKSKLELEALQSGVRQREAELAQKQRQELEFKQEQQRQQQLQLKQQAEKEAEKKQTEASDGKPGSSKPTYNPEQGYADIIETIKNWQLSATKGIQCISEELGRISATAAKAEELAELGSVSAEVRTENETVAESAEASKAPEAEADAEREIPPFSLGSPLSPVIDPRNWSHPDADQSRRMVYRLVKKEDDVPTFDVVSYEDAKDPADEFLTTESVNCQNGKDCKMCNCRISRQEPSQAGIKRALPLEFFDDDFVLI